MLGPFLILLLCAMQLSRCYSVATTESIPVEKAAQEGFSALFETNIPGVTVRQCSCDEERKCVQEIKDQVFACGEQCWYKFGEITTRPNDLKQCAEKKRSLFIEFLDCFETYVNACVENKSGPQIPKKDILKMFRIGEEKFATQKDSIMRNSMVKPIRKVVDTALEFGSCVKECFLAKNQNGFCFDHIGCQPLLTEKKSTSTLKKCMKRLDWKQEAGELCDCSVGAGVQSLERYCPMLRLMSGKRRGKTTTTTTPKPSVS